MVRVVLLAILLAIAYRAFGAANGLNIIPIADIYPRGTFALEAEREGRVHELIRGAGAGLFTQIGIGYGTELGYDFGRDDETHFHVWNIKHAIAYRKGEPALSLGIQNIGRRQKSQPYAVSWVSLGRGRLHEGVIGIEGNARGMLGYDAPIAEKADFLADFTSGRENAASAGVEVEISQHFVVHLAYIRNNSGPDRSGFLFHIGWYPEKLF